jgi:hypothetical protein
MFATRRVFCEWYATDVWNNLCIANKSAAEHIISSFIFNRENNSFLATSAILVLFYENGEILQLFICYAERYVEYELI